MRTRSSQAAVLRRAAERFLDRLPQVADDALGAWQAAIPWYGAISEDGALATLREAYRAHAACILRAVVEDRALGGRELKALAALGRERFAQETPLEDLMQAYQIGTEVALGHFTFEVERAACTRQDGLVRAVMGRGLRASREVTRAIASTYREAEAMGHPRPLIGPEDLALASVARLTAEPATDEELHRLAEVATEELGEVRCQTTMGKGHVVILALPRDCREARLVPAAIARLADAAAPRVHAGTGGVHQGRPGCRRSLAEALEVLDLLRSFPHLPSALTWHGAQPYLLLRQDPGRARAIVEAVLAPVLRVRGGEGLVATLDALATARSATEAAQVVGIHRRTLYARLARVAAVSGSPLHDPESAVLIPLALAARRLYPNPPA